MVKVLVINGTVGVGKTTTAQAVGRHWRDAGISGALIDADWLRYVWPSPTDDPHQVRLGWKNLATLVANAAGQGATRVVLADVIESPEERRRQTEVLQQAVPGLELRMVRLVADPELIGSRLVARQQFDDDGGAALVWHQHRVRELAAILDQARPEDAVVDVTDLRPGEVAEQVLAAAGWDETETS